MKTAVTVLQENHFWGKGNLDLSYPEKFGAKVIMLKRNNVLSRFIFYFILFYFILFLFLFFFYFILFLFSFI